ncbi:MAG: diacylglycerol kinase family lipid kinase [Acidobacteria bacterium]|nr:diacylglycerol kinase family lipid kinase [Acidobacteriota bacterium]
MILNARSGAGHNEQVQQRVVDAFAERGVRAHVSTANDGAALIRLARHAARSEAESVVAGGGDGTISAVAAAMIDSGKPLGVLPLGTLNHFAKDMEIPLDIEGAVDTIAAGRTAAIDVGDVNGRIFLNNSSVGLYPRIVHERENLQRLGWGKWPAYLWAAVAVLRLHPLLEIRLGVDGKELAGRTPFVFVGNNVYAVERLDIGTRACLDKGELSLYATSRTGRMGLIRLALGALLGGLRQERDFLAMTANDIWIGTKRARMRVALDGEVAIMEPPLHYRIRRGALRVLAPAGTQTP